MIEANRFTAAHEIGYPRDMLVSGVSFLNLEDRAVLVAGGGGGIGAELALVLAGCRARVLIADMDVGRAEEVSRELARSGAVTSAYQLDVTSEASVAELFAQIEREHGAVYGVVNCVGVVGAGAARDCPFEEYQRQIEINCYGAMRLARAFANRLGASSVAANSVSDDVRGSYVYISSIAADLAIPERDPYCVSKAAGQAFHLNLANEVAALGINVNVVLPGRTDTPSAAERARGSQQAAGQMYATQRRAAMIPAKTVAKTCAFLLSPELIGFSGQKIVISEGADTTYRPSYEALERVKSGTLVG
jgi:NAD(P)-dependent dehydrogenase (short-subunit alcohol dehydrogenase family)